MLFGVNFQRLCWVCRDNSNKHVLAVLAALSTGMGRDCNPLVDKEGKVLQAQLFHCQGHSAAFHNMLQSFPQVECRKSLFFTISEAF